MNGKEKNVEGAVGGTPGEGTTEHHPANNGGKDGNTEALVNINEEISMEGGTNVQLGFDYEDHDYKKPRRNTKEILTFINNLFGNELMDCVGEQRRDLANSW